MNAYFEFATSFQKALLKSSNVSKVFPFNFCAISFGMIPRFPSDPRIILETEDFPYPTTVPVVYRTPRDALATTLSVFPKIFTVSITLSAFAVALTT